MNDLKGVKINNTFMDKMENTNDLIKATNDLIQVSIDKMENTNDIIKATNNKREATNNENNANNLKDINNSPIQLINQLKDCYYINSFLSLSLAITLFSFVGIINYGFYK
jgi:hypothetical protein